MHRFDAAGIAVYALSYDEADALRDFRHAHGITFALLSDPESRVIESFGILNTLIDDSDHPWYGIPYPGAYVIAADGRITHKFFDNNLLVRAGPEQLLRAVQGRSRPDREQRAPRSVEEEVIVNVELEGTSLMPSVQKDLVAHFQIPAGRHVYAQPAPAGSVPVDIVLVENERLVERAMIRPPVEPHTLAATGETFDVHHGVFELRLPLTVNDDSAPEVTISGEVCWQSCDDQVCDIPSSKRFEIAAPVTASPLFPLRSEEGAQREPNAKAHFKKMTERRKRS